MSGISLATTATGCLLLLTACGTMPVPQWQYVTRDVVAEPVPVTTIIKPSTVIGEESSVVVRPLSPMPSIASLNPLPDVDLPVVHNVRRHPEDYRSLPTAQLPSSTPPTTDRDTAMAVARASHRRGDYNTARAVLRESGVAYDQAGGDGQLLRETTEALYQSQLRQGRTDSARELVAEVLREAPGDKQWRKRRERLARRQRAADLYQDYQQLPAQTPVEQRHHLLQEIRTMDPRHAGVIAALAALEGDLVEVFHQRAIGYFRRQQLQPAIRDWQRVLELDREHKQARIYLERALELQRRLDSLR